MVSSQPNLLPLFSSRFAFGQPMLLFGRARLYTDQIVLTGWHLRGRYRQDIPLRQILQIDVFCGEDVLLWLSSGKTIRLRVARPRLWKENIEAAMSSGMTS